jgi:inorganic pyrophosphatase
MKPALTAEVADGFYRMGNRWRRSARADLTARKPILTGNALRPASGGGMVEIEVIVEVPQGSRNKYEMDQATGRIRLDRMLFTSTRYPRDYGFIPDTLAEDGEPLDAMVMLEEPAFPGCLVTARPVGVFWMHDERGPDAKILAVPARDPRFEGIQDLDDVPSHVTAEIGHFFDIYKELEPGKSTDVRGWQDRTCALEVIEAAVQRARVLA